MVACLVALIAAPATDPGGHGVGVCAAGSAGGGQGWAQLAWAQHKTELLRCLQMSGMQQWELAGPPCAYWMSSGFIPAGRVAAGHGEGRRGAAACASGLEWGGQLSRDYGDCSEFLDVS